MEGYVVAVLIFIGITLALYILLGIAGIIALDCICRNCCASSQPASSDEEKEQMVSNQMTNNGVINENVFSKYVDDHI